MSDDHLASDLRLAVVRLNRRLRGQRGDTRVSLTQVSALSTLDMYGPMTPGTLAARERVQPPSMTRIIAGLEQLGFIDRVPHPTDGRQVIVSMSAAGAQFITDEVHAREVWMDGKLAELDPSERETLRAATAIIDRMVVGRDTVLRRPTTNGTGSSSAPSSSTPSSSTPSSSTPV
jgi:DNA-binding MarR family transcriptional regulator